MTAVHLMPENDLTRYLKEIRAFPILSADEEQTLARRWAESRDPEALRTLVGSHLRLVVKIAMGYRGYGLPLADLISEGNVGLMQATKRFDPDRGFRLSTYAIWWIKAAIQEHILRSWSIVKLGTTAAQKKLFFNLRTLKARLHALEEGDLAPETVTTIADELEVSETEVTEMNRRLMSPYESLNAPMTTESATEWQEQLVDEGDDQESRLAEREELAQRRARLQTAMGDLNERERRIVTARRLSDDPATLEVLSREYGISRERVRQIEARALEKLRHAMTRSEPKAPAALAAAA